MRIGARPVDAQYITPKQRFDKAKCVHQKEDLADLSMHVHMSIHSGAYITGCAYGNMLSCVKRTSCVNFNPNMTAHLT